MDQLTRLVRCVLEWWHEDLLVALLGDSGRSLGQGTAFIGHQSGTLLEAQEIEVELLQLGVGWVEVGFHNLVLHYLVERGALLLFRLEALFPSESQISQHLPTFRTLLHLSFGTLFILEEHHPKVDLIPRFEQLPHKLYLLV